MLELQEKILSELVVIKWALIIIACSPFILAGLALLIKAVGGVQAVFDKAKSGAAKRNGSVDV